MIASVAVTTAAGTSSHQILVTQYPQSPGSVGLTVARESMAVENAHRTFTTSQIVENTIFRRGVSVDGCEIAFRNCWIYRPAADNGQAFRFRFGTGQAATFEDCLIGYDGHPVAGLDPIGGVWNPADYLTPTSSSSRGSVTMRRCAIRYVREGPTLASNPVLIEDCWIGPFFTSADSDHVDAFQTTGPCNAVVRRTRVDATWHPASLQKSIRCFQLEATNGALDLTIADNFVSWVGATGIGLGTGFPYPADVRVIRNTFDRSVGDDTPFSGGATYAERWGNHWSDGSLLDGDSEGPA